MEWGLSYLDRIIRWIGPTHPQRNLKKAVWEPAHRLVADILGVDYVDDTVDCIGYIDEISGIDHWEIKTRHSGGDYLLRDTQHYHLLDNVGGYVFVTLDQYEWYKWRIEDVRFARVREVEEELGWWCDGPESRDYSVQWLDPDELPERDYTGEPWSRA